MKKIKLLLLILIIVVLVSCSNSSSHSTFINYPSTDSFTSVSWHLSNFTESEQNKQVNYKDYKFFFYPDNSVIALHNEEKTVGKWSVDSDWISDDSPANDVDFIIEFTDSGLSNLNGDYYIIERTLSKLKLDNRNPSSNNSKHLEFKKDF